MTFLLLLAVAFCFAIIIDFFTPHATPPGPQLTSSTLQECAWKSLKGHVSLLDVNPISRDEFLARQYVLKEELVKADVDAFIAEPSASTAYFANVSSGYELSERPFLLVWQRRGGARLLVPRFERGRILGLEMVFEGEGEGMQVLEWREEESAYEVLVKGLGLENGGKVMLDEHARFMIAAGLQDNGLEVVPVSRSIQEMRAVKSDAELDILRSVNEFTVQLVRSLQKCIRVGMSQETIISAAEGLFTQAGVGSGFWSIILFGEQAANPHGGGIGRVLRDGEFVLIDIGTSLHSYGSDVTRTILPPGGKVSQELMDVWELVFAAQTAAIERMNVDETCSVVDGVARRVIGEGGYAEFFTHRLGHGLGLEMHEWPFLNGVSEERLRAGEVVTNEPVSFLLYCLYFISIIPRSPFPD